VPGLGRKKSNMLKSSRFTVRSGISHDKNGSLVLPTLRIPPGYQLTDETEDESSEPKRTMPRTHPLSYNGSQRLPVDFGQMSQ